MKHLSSVLITIALWITATGQVTQISSSKTTYNGNGIEKCPINSDSLYNRQKVLKHLAKMLNDSIPEYREYFPKFYIEKDRAGGFFIYDLTDPLNKQLSLSDCIDFRNHHVYHFSPFEISFSFSHILILDDGNLKVFKSINCKGKRDSLEDVVNYLKNVLINDRDKDEIINRVRHYREYGTYIRVDNFSELQCEVNRNGEN